MKVLFIANVDETKQLPAYIQEFVNKGHQIKICRVSGMFHRWNLFVRMKKRFNFDIRNDVRFRKKRMEKKILSVFEDFNPDIVCEINGMMLNSHCADTIRKRAFLVAKMIDRISFFPEYYEDDFSTHYDVIYTYALDDYNIINSISQNCVFVPAMCEEDIYRELRCDRNIDISLVGKMYPKKDYGERFSICCQMIEDFPDLNIFIGGECAPIRRPLMFLKWYFNPLWRKSFNNKQITTQECNEIYNKSKISISIERNGTGNSWSGRLVNLFGTRTFVLTSDDSEMLKKYFSGCYVSFTDYEDLKVKISYYLKHEDERNEIASRAYDRIQQLKNNPININMTEDILNRKNNV